jgi:D-alanyl-D-alanine carboxypeptidase
MKVLSPCGESPAGTAARATAVTARKLGFVALIVAIAALMSPYPALAVRLHHAAAKAEAADEESNASTSSTALGAYSEACVLEPVTGTVIFESNDHAPWPTASLA